VHADADPVGDTPVTFEVAPGRTRTLNGVGALTFRNRYPDFSVADQPVGLGTTQRVRRRLAVDDGSAAAHDQP
jgi:hypothetical protein